MLDDRLAWILLIRSQSAPLSPPPISTAIPPMHEALTTPRAQTRQEAERIENERAERVKSNILEGMADRRPSRLSLMGRRYSRKGYGYG